MSHFIDTFGLRVSLAAAGLIGCASALAQPTLPSNPGGESATNAVAAPHAQRSHGAWRREVRRDDTITDEERSFVQRAAEAGLFEVRASRLAVVRSRSPVVKKIATEYVMDHTAANARLTQLANRWHVELPIAAPRAKRRLLAAIGKKRGAAFDAAFLDETGIQAHEESIATLERAQDRVRNPALRGWIEHALPMLRRHLAHARDAASGRTDLS